MSWSSRTVSAHQVSPVTILASSHTVSALQAPPVTISASPRPLGFLAFTWPYGDTLRFSCTTRFTSVALWFSRSTALGRSLTPPTALTIDFSRIFSQTRWWRLESYLTTTKPTDATKISKWIKEDAQIMTWLWNSLEPDVFNNVSYLESSKDIWDTLHLMYSSEENITRIHELYQDMFSLQQGDRSIEEYFSFLQDLDPIRFQILSRKDIPTVRETYAQGERGDHSSRRGTHNGRGNRGGHSGGGGRGPRKCTHCGRTNHTIDFCWKLYGKPAWANHATVDGDNSTPIFEEQVLISKVEYDSILQHASSSSMVASGNICLHSSSSPPWVIDSGASDHMTGNSSLLSNISNPSSPFSVIVANGTKTLVQGIGTVSTPNLIFSNVLYFPKFPFNLLSVHKLTVALHCSIAFFPSYCVFQDLKSKRTIGGGFEKDGLYYFRLFHTSIPSALRSSVSPYQWHCRLGHPSATFKLRNDEPCLHPFELVHSDVWGPACTTGLCGKSPFEILFADKSPFSVPLKVFGCVSFIHNLNPSRDKLDPRALKCIFLGYSRTHKGYRCYSPSLQKHFVSADVTFFEDVPYYSSQGGQESILSSPVIPTPIPFAPQAPPISYVYVCCRHQGVPLVPPLVESPPLLPSSASTSADLPLPQSISDLDLPIALRKISSIVVPKSYREALSHPGWRKAMEEEMHALDLNHTWDLIHKPAGTSIVGCRWVFTVKQNPDGTVDRLKAHLVAKGFTQTYGLDYTKTFSPVAKLNSIHIIISLAVNLDWTLHQLDVKNAFLHGDLNETVYMAQPPGFESKGECVCHLKKSIYGLKQSPRAWFDKFSKAVVSHGMTRSQADHSVFFKKTKIGIVILVVYVDDIVITGSDKEGIQILINHLSSSFLTKYLGYLGSKHVATPMESNLKLMPDEGDFIDDPDTYRRLVVIRILKYLKNAPSRGLFYRSSGHLRIEGYTNADWAGSPSNRKSTTGYCTFIGGNLVMWRSKKQSVVARSSAEAEYRAMAHTTCELTWLRTVLQEFGLLTLGLTPFYCDNQAAIHIASNPVFHERTKHIKVDCHFVRSKVESKDIITPFVPFESQLANIFTKALPKNAIDSICSKLGVIDIYSPA
uniref:Uncharacterized protein n=1 Tax=Fagus sylvatica TaxID=28930 RepID=A0A2N9H562_FAGSY